MKEDGGKRSSFGKFPRVLCQGSTSNYCSQEDKDATVAALSISLESGQSDTGKE